MPDNIFRVTTIGTMYGQQCQNVFHLLGPSSDPAQLSAVADHVAANWVAFIRTKQTSAFTYTGVKVRLLESQFPPHLKTINIAGSNGFDDELSTVQAWILRLRSAEIGKRGRGRLYIPGVMKGWTKNGLVIAAQITGWDNLIVQMMDVYGPNHTSDYQLTIVPGKAPFSTREVTSMQIAPTLGTQRRRNIGIGV